MPRNEKKSAKRINKVAYNPISQGILYFGFALLLWSNKQIDDVQIKAIAIFLTVISFLYFLAIYSEWVYKNMNRANKVLVPLTFFAFVIGFIFGWIDAFSKVTGIVLELIVYFGFVWIITILLVEVKEVENKRVRIYGSILVVLILLSVSITNFLNSSYISGGILIAISVLIILVALKIIKLQGSVFQ